jgi:hypothetical protein
MSVSTESNDGVVLNKIKLKYLTRKKDNYGNENVYYAIETEGFGEIVQILGDTLKVPWFKGDKNTVLKVKARWLKGNKKAETSGITTITLKEYDYEGTKGYYVSAIALK